MTKYFNKKVKVDGIVFDSKKEAMRYLYLLSLLKKGLIKDLELQKPFVLIPTQREPEIRLKNGKTKQGKVIEREIRYIADFTYKQGAKTIVEDVKGYRGGGAYTVFTMKRKLMLYVFGIKVREL